MPKERREAADSMRNPPTQWSTHPNAAATEAGVEFGSAGRGSADTVVVVDAGRPGLFIHHLCPSCVRFRAGRAASSRSAS